MIDRIIHTKKPMIFTATRMEYLAITKNKRCASDLLNLFENFHKSKEEEVVRRMEENRLYNVTVQDYKQRWSLKAIGAGLLNLYSKPTIIKNLEWLCKEGLIKSVNIASQNNVNQIEGREVVFIEKEVQLRVDEIMEKLSKRPMPSEVLELIEREEKREKDIAEAVKNLTGGGCQKFDREAVKNLTTNRYNIDNLILIEKEKENFEKNDSLGSGDESEAILIKYEEINKSVPKNEKINNLGLFDDDKMVELGEKIEEMIWRVWNENGKMKEMLIKKCEIVGQNVDYDKIVSVYLLAFTSKFIDFEKRAWLIQSDNRLFNRFVSFIYDSMQFYNQNYSSNKKAKNGNDEFGFNTGGGESRDGITSKGGQPTKAESAIYALLHGK